jgi:hypothetical protein
MSITDSFIDERILFVIRPQWRKVAFVLTKVAHEFDAKGISVSEERLELRLRALIELRQIEPAGDVSRWRFSEVRLPVNGEPRAALNSFHRPK